MSHDPREFQIPVIFDVTAMSREEAGEGLVHILAGHQLVGNVALPPDPNPQIESWWTVEHVDKGHDGNDNEHGVVVFQHDLDYLHSLLLATRDTVRKNAELLERHERLMSYFAPNRRVGSARIGTPDHRDEDGY